MTILTLASFISHYFLGNKDTGIPPLRRVTTGDLKHSAGSEAKPNLKIISDMKEMMTYVETAAREAEVWENDPSRWTTAKVTELYEKT